MRSPLNPSESEKPLVVLLHGILLNRWFLWPLERFLKCRGHRTLNLTYPSTRSTIEELAEEIASRISAERAKSAAPRVSLVTHSLGGLIGRRLISRGLLLGAHRFVQVVPPNRGSAMARAWRDRVIYRALYGTGAGWQLGESPDVIDEICGRPEDIKWGIVMGRTAHGLRSSLLQAPHDGVVSQSEMRVEQIPAISIDMGHTPILFLPEMWHEVASFLEKGEFKELETGPPSLSPHAGLSAE